MNKNTENPVNAASWDKIFPKSDKVEHKKSVIQKPLWYHPYW